MRLCLMIEGQESVSWEDWLALAGVAQALGFEGLFTSDHYGSVQGRAGRASFDAWTVLGALAGQTHSIRLGTLVSPATFRHPSVLAKAVVTVDHVSGGRAELGMGTGWFAAEHESYGFPFPSMRLRTSMLAEQIEIVHRSWTEDAFSFAGAHYTLRECRPLPKPLQRPHPPLLVGGRGGPRSAAIAARFADEYNIVSTPRDDATGVRRALVEACEKEGRDPRELGTSYMTAVCIGTDTSDVRARAARIGEWMGWDDAEGLLRTTQGRWLIGTPDDVVAQIAELADAGVGRVHLQMLLHRDLEAIEIIARDVAPKVAGI
jgi:F420-dependent oxidoreductase-like protein